MRAVSDKPSLSCESDWSAQLGQTDYEILCTGHMNPDPHQVVWTWETSEADGEVEIYNEIINDDHLAEVGSEQLHLPENFFTKLQTEIAHKITSPENCEFYIFLSFFYAYDETKILFIY